MISESITKELKKYYYDYLHAPAMFKLNPKQEFGAVRSIRFWPTPPLRSFTFLIKTLTNNRSIRFRKTDFASYTLRPLTTSTHTVYGL